MFNEDDDDDDSVRMIWYDYGNYVGEELLSMVPWDTCPLKDGRGLRNWTRFVEL